MIFNINICCRKIIFILVSFSKLFLKNQYDILVTSCSTMRLLPQWGGTCLYDTLSSTTTIDSFYLGILSSIFNKNTITITQANHNLLETTLIHIPDISRPHFSFWNLPEHCIVWYYCLISSIIALHEPAVICWWSTIPSTRVATDRVIEPTRYLRDFNCIFIRKRPRGPHNMF